MADLAPCHSCAGLVPAELTRVQFHELSGPVLICPSCAALADCLMREGLTAALRQHRQAAEQSLGRSTVDFLLTNACRTGLDPAVNSTEDAA